MRNGDWLLAHSPFWEIVLLFFGSVLLKFSHKRYRNFSYRELVRCGKLPHHLWSFWLTTHGTDKMIAWFLILWHAPVFIPHFQILVLFLRSTQNRNEYINSSDSLRRRVHPNYSTDRTLILLQSAPPGDYTRATAATLHAAWGVCNTSDTEAAKLPTLMALPKLWQISFFGPSVRIYGDTIY